MSILSVEMEMVKQVIVGCSKSVLLAEHRWYHKRLRPRGPTEKERALSSIFWPSLSLSSTFNDGFRPAELSHLGLESVSPPVVNRGLKSSVNIGYHKKQEGKPRDDGLSGPNVVYVETDLLSTLKKLVSDLKYRAIIYTTLRLSHFLERRLRVCHYAELITCKHIGIKDALKRKRTFALLVSPILETDIEEYEKNYVENQKLLKQKSNNEILLVACLRAKNSLHDKLWHSDIDYTRIFIEGGIAYSQIQIV